MTCFDLTCVSSEVMFVDMMSVEWALSKCLNISLVIHLHILYSNEHMMVCCSQPIVAQESQLLNFQEF